MPLRRPPPEPSPRLRALLASTAVAPKEPGRPRLGGCARGDCGPAGCAGPVAPGSRPGSSVPRSPAPARPVARGRRAARGDHAAPGGVDRRLADPGRGRHRRPAPPRARLFTLPEALVGARLSGPRAAVAGLLVVAVVAAIGFGVRVAWARAASTPEVVAPAQPGSAVGGRASGSTGFASSSTASGGGGPPGRRPSTGSRRATLTVHVVGQVRKPGVIKLPGGVASGRRGGQGRRGPPAAPTWRP